MEHWEQAVLALLKKERCFRRFANKVSVKAVFTKAVLLHTTRQLSESLCSTVNPSGSEMESGECVSSPPSRGDKNIIVLMYDVLGCSQIL